MTKRLFLLSPPVVFTARVNQAGRSYPVTEVPFDAGVALGTVVEGMTVVFGTSAGASDLGRQRVRAGSTLGATGTLNIGRSSIGNRDGEVNIADDAYITIWNDFRAWAKIPLILFDGTIYKDTDIVVGTKTSNIPPKANIEPTAAAGDIATGTNVMTVSFSGTTSYANSGTISTYLWDVDDGAITVGTSASSTITATFPAGFRWVSLTVTDSNANTHIMRVPVYARNPASDTTIKNFQIERERKTIQGQELSFRILESIPESTYPDGTLVMLWDQDLTTITNGPKFVGWHHTDPAEIEAGRTALLSEVTLDCLDMAGKLKTLPGFPISVEGKASPASWLEMSAPDMDKYIDYILRWHSTALELAHFTPSGTGTDYPFVILASDASSLWEQAARRCQSLVPDYVLTCDTNGRITMKPDQHIVAVAERTATIQTTIDESEWSSIRYTRQRSPRVHWLRSEAVLASSTVLAALFSVAPDDTPGQGVSNRTQGEQLARNQTDLNAAEGNRYARLNAFESHFNIGMAAGNDLDIEPADLTWVRLTMSAATAANRGLAFTDERGIVHEISINHRYGRSGHTKEVSIIWERETDGPPAKAFIPPVMDPTIPYEPPPDPGFDPTPTGAGTGLGTVYVQTGNAIGRTRDFGASSPAWVNIAPTIGSGSFVSYVLDPWRPATTGFAITSTDGIYRSTDLDQVTPTWSQVLSLSDITMALSGIGATGFQRIEHHFEGSVNFDGHFLFFAWIQTPGNDFVYCIRTTDRGDTWSYNVVGNFAGSAGWQGAAAIVQRIVNGNMRVYATGRIGTTNSIRRSDDGGITWSTVSTAQIAAEGRMGIHIPYHDNPTGQTFYVYGVNQIAKTIDGGATFTGITSNDCDPHRWGVESYTQNKNRLYRIHSGVTPHEMYITNDGFATEYEAPMAGMSDAQIMATGGFPFNGGLFYLVSNAGIYVSTDRGQSWAKKTGDWAFGFSFVVSESKRAVIVPLWTE